MKRFILNEGDEDLIKYVLSDLVKRLERTIMIYFEIRYSSLRKFFFVLNNIFEEGITYFDQQTECDLEKEAFEDCKDREKSRTAIMTTVGEIDKLDNGLLIPIVPSMFFLVTKGYPSLYYTTKFTIPNFRFLEHLDHTKTRKALEEEYGYPQKRKEDDNILFDLNNKNTELNWVIYCKDHKEDLFLKIKEKLMNKKTVIVYCCEKHCEEIKKKIGLKVVFCTKQIFKTYFGTNAKYNIIFLNG